MTEPPRHHPNFPGKAHVLPKPEQPRPRPAPVPPYGVARQITKGRLAYVLALIGRVDVEDSDEGWRAYAEHILEVYSFTDLDDDPDYERIAGGA